MPKIRKKCHHYDLIWYQLQPLLIQLSQQDWQTRLIASPNRSINPCNYREVLVCLFFSDTKPATTVTKDTKSPLFNFSSTSGKNQSVNNQKESTPAIQLYVSFQPTTISSGGFFDFDKNMMLRVYLWITNQFVLPTQREKHQLDLLKTYAPNDALAKAKSVTPEYKLVS